MTFDARERSNFSGEPFELFRWSMGATTWLQAMRTPRLLQGQIYAPAAVSRTEVDQNGETSSGNVTVTLDLDNPVAQLFREGPPSTPVSLIVTCGHDEETETACVFTGRIMSAKLQEVCDPHTPAVRIRGHLMGFWVALAMMVISTVVSAMLAPKPKDAEPSSLGEFQVPTAEEGRPIPMVLGPANARAQTSPWWGALRTEAIQRVSNAMTGHRATIGYRYRLGMQQALTAGPIDELVILL